MEKYHPENDEINEKEFIGSQPKPTVVFTKCFKLFRLKRKIGGFVPDEGFFAPHSLSYGARKRQNMGQKVHFAANWGKFKPLLHIFFVANPHFSINWGS